MKIASFMSMKKYVSAQSEAKGFKKSLVLDAILELVFIFP